MIDILIKYYNITINDYEVVDNGITFFVYDSKFYLYKCCLDEDKVNSIYNKISEYVIDLPLHSFVFNKDNHLYSDGFVLFKLNVFVEDVFLSDIDNFNKRRYILFDYVKMDDFWFEKIDYLEYQLINLSDKKIVNCSFDYFVGLAELLILFYKDNFNINENDLCLSHKEFNNLSSLEFYNPLNLSIDYKYKDIVSYIRYTNDYSLLNKYLNIIDNNEKIYFFVRLCFPFKYFESLNRVLFENDENIIVDIIDEIEDYEKYLLWVEAVFNISLFSWIKKE